MNKATLAARIIEQHKWIEDHGSTHAGYVRRYGSKNDPEHYGDGGEAIYAADMAELHTLCRQWKAVSR